MKSRIMNRLAIAVLLALFLAPFASAHEFIIKPAHMNPMPGQKLPFSVVSAHVFMVSEEMEPVEQVSVNLVRGEEKTAAHVVKNETLLTLDGAADIRTEGTYILSGHRKGVIWSNTTQGWKQAGKKGLTGVISSGKYEKFCKTLVNAGTPDEGYKTVVGHALEIVPMSDPAKVEVGDEADFQILFEGKPLTAEVYATYDGFSSRTNTYAYFTETDETGVAHVKIDHPGLWMVRTENKLDKPTDDYDTHVLRAVLVFNVR